MTTGRGVAAGALSTRRLAIAPHRLMFFIGAINLVLAMAWWAAWLASARWPEFALPQPEIHAGWVHAFVMQYQVLPSFFFGFLLTTFPKWTGQTDVRRVRYVPVGLGLFGGQLATLLGAMGVPHALWVGAVLTLLGFTAGVSILASLLWRERGTTWHAWSCLAALVLGLVGVCGWLASVLGASTSLLFASIKLGTFGLLLPVYFTVAHRMFPFFAGNAVPGYVPWRPMWLLAVFWALAGLHLVLELCHATSWLWLADLPLLVLTATLCVRWWPRCMTRTPRSERPALLMVLFVGLAWLPVTFALYVVQNLTLLATGTFWLGRAPAHALFIGFFGSVLVAMVTRVTQGHSGRPLRMPAAAWFAFIAIQIVAVMRVVAEVAPDGMAWQMAAAIGWLLAFVPWIVRIGCIYLLPRADGKPG